MEGFEDTFKILSLKKMKNCLLILAFIFIGCGFSRLAWGGEEWKGMDVVRYCTGDTVLFDESICRAYIQGIVDAHEFDAVQGTASRPFCIPKDKVEREKGESLVPKWLATFPEKWHRKSVNLIVSALKDIFPCPK